MSTLLDVLVLAVVQGLTEFLPVSSSGHLAVGQMLLGIKEGNLMLSVTLHAGTLLATLVFFKARLLSILSDVLSSITQPMQLWEKEAGRDALIIVLASIPTAALGLLLKDWVEAWTTEPAVVAVCFVVTAVLLWSIRVTAVGTNTTVNAWGALLLGVMQGLAVMPGISRSGATIAILIWLRVRSVRAFELSMLVSLPAILGAFLLEASQALPRGRFGPDLAVGAFVSFAVGLLALYWLRGLVTKGRLFLFALYLLPLAAVTYFGVS